MAPVLYFWGAAFGYVAKTADQSPFEFGDGFNRRCDRFVNYRRHTLCRQLGERSQSNFPDRFSAERTSERQTEGCS